MHERAQWIPKGCKAVKKKVEKCYPWFCPEPGMNSAQQWALQCRFSLVRALLCSAFGGSRAAHHGMIKWIAHCPLKNCFQRNWDLLKKQPNTHNKEGTKPQVGFLNLVRGSALWLYRNGAVWKQTRTVWAFPPFPPPRKISSSLTLDSSFEKKLWDHSWVFCGQTTWETGVQGQ